MTQSWHWGWEDGDCRIAETQLQNGLVLKSCSKAFLLRPHQSQVPGLEGSSLPAPSGPPVSGFSSLACVCKADEQGVWPAASGVSLWGRSSVNPVFFPWGSSALGLVFLLCLYPSFKAKAFVLSANSLTTSWHKESNHNLPGCFHHYS